MRDGVRKWISFAALFVGVLVATVFLASSVSNWLIVQAQIEQAIAEQSVPPAADPARYLIPGENGAVASSNLQTMLNDAARRAGATTSRSQLDQGVGNNPLMMALNFEAEGEMEDLAALLHTLESGVPAIIVEEARLSPIRNSSRLQLRARLIAHREPGAPQ